MRREKKERRKKIDSMRKGIYILPNLFTSASLFCGFFSMLRTLQEDFYTAGVLILVSGLLDGMDGKIARFTNTTSRFGVEYDSLADVISLSAWLREFSFTAWALEPFGRLGWMAAFLFVVCGALRLGRFNIQVNTVESRYFNGLADPGGRSPDRHRDPAFSTKSATPGSANT